MAPATLVFRDKLVFPDGAILEIIIWRLPQPDVERPHGLKYSLYYGKDGVRLVGTTMREEKGITGITARTKSNMNSRLSSNLCLTSMLMCKD